MTGRVNFGEAVKERVLARVRIAPDGCWLWSGAKAYKPTSPSRAYGIMTVEGRRYSVKYISWRIWKGEPPKDRTIIATCGRSLCVNPDHLIEGPYARSSGRPLKDYTTITRENGSSTIDSTNSEENYQLLQAAL